MTYGYVCVHVIPDIYLNIFIHEHGHSYSAWQGSARQSRAGPGQGREPLGISYNFFCLIIERFDLSIFPFKNVCHEICYGPKNRVTFSIHFAKLESPKIFAKFQNHQS